MRQLALAHFLFPVLVFLGIARQRRPRQRRRRPEVTKEMSVTLGGMMTNCTGFSGISYFKHPFIIGNCHESRLNYKEKVQLKPKRISTTRHQCLIQDGSTARYDPSFRRNQHELKLNHDNSQSSFWSPNFSKALLALKSLFIFLAEQPSQLKYIEWPSFQSTLKTAMLTLVLVAILIVALSSIDAALSFLLALFLRRTA